ncbi:hypothetical protein BXQ17_08110 [Polaribacter sp. BM10]|uniref:hypothetical protein n=1 Tax=Polaribacter sp. BM10 TaxID=1529069 RepID=UPI00098A6F20|nr:hypothetical protein [Polaribacter sp. BM10]AQS94030.1 hypothetical protein BXQ17_08110 [Polaribacter sp. BM10]
MCFDTLHIEHQVKNIPLDFVNQKNETLSWLNLKWHPIINNREYLSCYYTYIGNLRLVFKGDKIYIKNSLQKFFMNNNYQSFSYSQVVDAFSKLNQLVPFNIYEAIVTRLAVGVVIEEDAQKAYNEWKFYMGKPPKPMYEKNKIYGSKFHLNDYYIKAYDKTFQVKCKDSINIGKPYFRYEIEGKTKFFNNKTNNVGITTVTDLINKEKYKKLCNVLIDRYQMIDKEAQKDLSKLTLKEMRLVASMRDFKIKESIRKQYSHTYKKERLKYLSLMRNVDNTEFQNKVFNKLNTQIQYSVNN